MCGICGKISTKSICAKCNIMLTNYASNKIEDYSQTSSYFDEHIYIFQYNGEIRKTLLRYKFEEKSYIYRTFVNFLKSNEKICNQIKRYDIIIPIPISKKRFKQRGYNQSSIFAKSIAKALDMQYEEKVLLKIKENNPQSSLNQEERIKNVKGVYTIVNSLQDKVQQKNILLIDDIYTTGSTVNECSKLLKQSGANKIGVFTIAKD